MLVQDFLDMQYQGGDFIHSDEYSQHIDDDTNSVEFDGYIDYLMKGQIVKVEFSQSFEGYSEFSPGDELTPEDNSISIYNEKLEITNISIDDINIDMNDSLKDFFNKLVNNKIQC